MGNLNVKYVRFICIRNTVWRDISDLIINKNIIPYMHALIKFSFVCWYVCMPVCLYVGMFVCRYVCVLACLYVGKNDYYQRDRYFSMLRIPVCDYYQRGPTGCPGRICEGCFLFEC